MASQSSSDSKDERLNGLLTVMYHRHAVSWIGAHWSI